jgi:hypothetical protein
MVWLQALVNANDFDRMACSHSISSLENTGCSSCEVTTSINCWMKGESVNLKMVDEAQKTDRVMILHTIDVAKDALKKTP